MKKINKFLYTFDFFSNGPTLYINNESSLKSTFGGVLSLFTIGVVITLCYLTGKDIIFKENPKLLIIEEDSKYEPFKFTNGNFFLGIKLEDRVGNNYLNSHQVVSMKLYHKKAYKIINETISTGQQQMSNDIIWIEEKKSINLALCTDINKTIDNLKNYSLFEEIDLETMYCADDYVIDIGGSYDDNNISFFEIEISPCINSTDKSFNCLSKDERNKIISDSYISFYFTNQRINPKNYDIPLQPYINNKYALVQTKIYKELETYYKKINVKTDIGFIFNRIKKMSGVIIDFMTIDTLERIDDHSPLLRNYIYFSNKNINYERSYLKVTSLFADVGGIMQIFINLAIFLNKPINEKNINCSLMSDLYEFEFDQKQKINHSNNKFSYDSNKSNYDRRRSNFIVPKSTLNKLTDYLNVKNSKKISNTAQNFKYNSLEKNYEQIINENISLNTTEKGQQINNFILKTNINRVQHKIIDSKKLCNIKIEDYSEMNSIQKNDVEELNEVEFPNNINSNFDVINLEKNDIDLYPKIIETSKLIFSKIKNTKLKYSLFEILRSVYCCKILNSKKITIKDKLYDKCYNQVKEYFNLNSIIKKMRETEIIKMLLFNQGQNDCINIASKPIINISHLYQRQKANIEIVDKESERQAENAKNIFSVVEYFLTLKKLEENSIDYKLLQFQDQNVVNLLNNILDQS